MKKHQQLLSMTLLVDRYPISSLCPDSRRTCNPIDQRLPSGGRFKRVEQIGHRSPVKACSVTKGGGQDASPAAVPPRWEIRCPKVRERGGQEGVWLAALFFPRERAEFPSGDSRAPSPAQGGFWAAVAIAGGLFSESLKGGGGAWGERGKRGERQEGKSNRRQEATSKQAIE